MESDTDSVRSGLSEMTSVGGISERGEGDEVIDPTPEAPPLAFIPRVTQHVDAFASLDGVTLRDVFDTRVSVTHSVPHFLKGAFRGAIRVALQGILRGYELQSGLRITRGWKLFMLLPRLLLFRPRRGGKVSKKTLEERFQMFQEGRWLELLGISRWASAQVHQSSVRRRRRQHQDDGIQSELSAARQALEGANVASGNLATLRALMNRDRRPPFARQELSQEILHSDQQSRSCWMETLVCQRTARRGAAPGPSGMTADHLFPILESEVDSGMLVQVASRLAVGDIPEEVVDGIRLGRLRALAKPDGGVRRIVVGDIVRRLVARTMAKQIEKKAEKATAPFQCALSTKAGCECVAHIVQALTDQDVNATVVTVDGVGAFDLISRNATLEGLLSMEGGDQILPFARLFYGTTSTYLWEDEMGNTQEIPQGDGGEQGDPLTPMLFSLGEHPALEAIRRRLLDDETVVCLPDRVCAVLAIMAEDLARHAHISIHHGKTQVWNRGGIAPEGIEELTRLARLVKPEAIVWRCDVNLSHDQQDVRILGVPIGSAAFVRRQLEEKSAEQETLFHRIPLMDDTQACWLLLLMCAATRANSWLRAVRPEQSEPFADTNVWMCLRSILGSERAPDSTKAISQLPFSLGGLGLTSAVRSRVAAHWSSWVDCIHMIRQRHPSVHRHPPRPSTVLRGSEDLSGHVGGSRVGDSIVEDIS